MNGIEIANNFISTLNVEVKVVESNNENGVALYNREENAIYLNSDRVKREIQLFGFSLEDYITVLVCHELGHSLDETGNEIEKRCQEIIEKINQGEFSVSSEYKQLVITLEKNAWELGEKFVPKHLIREYESLNRWNIERRTLSIENLLTKLQANIMQKHYQLELAKCSKEKNDLFNQVQEYMSNKK